MTRAMTFAGETIKLASAVREWAVADLRPFARAADRTHVVPDGALASIATCPVQASPTSGKLDYPNRHDPGFDPDQADGTFMLAVAVAEAMAYGDALFLSVFRNGSGLGGKVVKILGTPEQVQRWAAPLDRGEYHYASFALTEPTGGSDAAALRTTAVRTDRSWILNGHKHFISGAATSDYAVVFATIDRAAGYKGIRAFVVPLGTPGFVVVKRNESKLGIRALLTSELALDNVEIPLDQCLGWPDATGDGLRSGLRALNTTRGLVASMATGIAQASLDQGREYLGARRRCFSPRRLDAIEAEFDELDAVLQRCRLLSRRLAWRLDQGLDHQREAAMAKGYTPPVAERIVHRVLQLMGPDGYSEEFLVEKWHRDIKIIDIWEGTGNIQRVVLGRNLRRASTARTTGRGRAGT
jgi:acyl-CoA dehydrogenase